MKSLCLIKLLFTPRMFCSNTSITEHWATYSAVLMTIWAVLWHTGHHHGLQCVWEAELVVRWKVSSCLQPQPQCTPRGKSARPGASSQATDSVEEPRHTEAQKHRSRVTGSWAWGVNIGEGRRGHPGTKRWEAEHVCAPQGLSNYIWQCSSEAAFFSCCPGNTVRAAC